METRKELNNHLRRFRRRIRLYDGWMLLQRTIWLAGLGVALVLLAGRLWPIENWVLWALIPVAVWLFFVLVFSLLRPLSPMRVACRVDTGLSLKERLSSSLELSVHPDVYQGELVDLLHVDALETARNIEPDKAFPLRGLRNPLLLGALMLVVSVALLVVPNPMDAVLAERRLVEMEARQQAQKIEELQKEIEQSKDMEPEDKEELLRQLAELAEKLKANPGDREQALADLSKVEEELRQRLDADSLGSQASLESLAARLQEMAGLENQPPGDELAAAAAALAELSDLSNISDEGQRQALVDSLTELSARASQTGNPSLAQALAAMASAVRSGDNQAASQAAKAAQNALSQAKSKQAQQAALQRSLSQVSACRNSLSSKSNSGIPGMVQGPTQGKGAGSGGGSRANVLPPSVGGQNRVQAPRGNKPVNPADLLNQSVFVPRIKGESNGEELQISGQDTGLGQEETSESPNPLPGQTNQPLVPYQDVYQQYLDSANTAMDRSYVPENLKDYVRSYFSQLEP